MSRVVPGLLGIFRLGTLVVMCDRTSRDVPTVLGLLGRSVAVPDMYPSVSGPYQAGAGPI